MGLSVYFFVTRIGLRNFVEKTMGYFHVYTKGLEDRLIFRDREDYIAGMNLVAVACFSVGVRVLAFVLMSNHVHFVVKGSFQGADRFIYLYKNLLSRYLSWRYGTKQFLHNVKTSVAAVEMDGDALKRLIAYILNNPVKAGIMCVPQGYEWSSARCYFNSMDSARDTRLVGELGVDQARAMFHTKKRLPADWRVCSSGYVTPESYIDVDEVEKCYGTSRSFEYFLSSSLSVRKGVNENVTFSDAVLRAAMAELLDKKYMVADVGQLNSFLLSHLLRDLKSRFGAPTQQLARVVGVSLSEVLRSLE